MKTALIALLLLTACMPEEGSSQQPTRPTAVIDREGVSEVFVEHVHDVLADSSGMFKGDYPDAAPITCELLEGLDKAMKDDSVRYHFEHLSQRYWARDTHYHDVERYIKRHMDFHLSIAASAHFFGDIRIMGLRELYNYRRRRPQVCATRDHYAELEKQDRQAVRYLLTVLETTPLFIPGSENSTIHGVYIGEVVRTLDLFTGQNHFTQESGQLSVSFTNEGITKALPEWKGWLE